MIQLAIASIACMLLNDCFPLFLFKKMTLFMNQSNYIPWKGFFDNIAAADIFVIYDHVQYTRHDWRNRNLIKSPNGLKWLTIPVVAKGYYKKINETFVSDVNWPIKHLAKLKSVYGKAAHYQQMIGMVEEFYMSIESTSLSDINIHFLKKICAFLDIKTKFIISTDIIYEKGERTESIINVCKSLKIDTYTVGPAAKSYINETLFTENCIDIRFVDYSGYPTYNQLFPPFEHKVSIFDLIFNCGESSINYIKHGQKNIIQKPNLITLPNQLQNAPINH